MTTTKKSAEEEHFWNAFRTHFAFPEPNLIYLDGNSLGRMPLAVRPIADRLSQEWSTRLVRGWGDGWITLSARIAEKIARIIGADAKEVFVGDSTSINLYKLAFAALEETGYRRIVTEAANFPSDLYVLQGLRRSFPGIEIVTVGNAEEIESDSDALLRAAGDEPCLVALSHVAFRSGYRHDLEDVTRRVQGNGSRILWDLSHSVGVMPIKLTSANADYAVGCTYKYLNGGPGAPAFGFVRRDLAARSESPIQGWFGQRSPFQFDLDYAPAEGVARFGAGTPPILSLAATEPGLDIALEAGLDRMRARSEALSARLEELYDGQLAPLGFVFKSPRDPALRGSHLSFGHPEAWRITQALIAENVIPDFRVPDNVRFGLAPLYNGLDDVEEAVARLADITRSRRYETMPSSMGEVT